MELRFYTSSVASRQLLFLRYAKHSFAMLQHFVLLTSKGKPKTADNTPCFSHPRGSLTKNRFTFFNNTFIKAKKRDTAVISGCITFFNYRFLYLFHKIFRAYRPQTHFSFPRPKYPLYIHPRASSQALCRIRRQTSDYALP